MLQSEDGVKIMNDILDWLDLPVTLLAGRVSKEKFKEFIRGDYKDIRPCEWVNVFSEDELLLGEGSELRHMFRSAGMIDDADMILLILQLFYLRHRMQGEWKVGRL